MPGIGASVERLCTRFTHRVHFGQLVAFLGLLTPPSTNTAHDIKSGEAREGVTVSGRERERERERESERARERARERERETHTIRGRDCTRNENSIESETSLLTY